MDEVPFNSRRKYHLTLHRISDSSVFSQSEFMIGRMHGVDNASDASNNSNFLVLVKGAPEYLLTMCSTIIFDNRQVALNTSLVAKVIRANEQLAGCGERVLALAYKFLPADKYPHEHQLDLRSLNVLKFFFL